MTMALSREPRAGSSTFAFTDQQWSTLFPAECSPAVTRRAVAKQPDQRTDEERAAVAQLDTRKVIETAVTIFRHRHQRRAAAMSPAEARDELAAARASLRDVQERVRRLEQRQPVDWSLSFKEALTHLHAADLHLYLPADEVAALVPSRPRKGAKGGTRPRRPEMDTYHLVGVLGGADLLNSRKRPSKQSGRKQEPSRKFVRAIIHIAGLGISDNTIDRALNHLRAVAIAPAAPKVRVVVKVPRLGKWTDWTPCPDRAKGGFIVAPFGPGCYELRMRNLGSVKLVLFGSAGNVSYRMSSLHPSGAGTRRNSKKRAYVGAHLPQIEYRVIALASRDEARDFERRELWSQRDRYIFKT